TPALIVRAALELGRALTFTQRPAQAMDVFESARAAVDGDEPEMRGVLEAAILHTGMSEPSLYPRVRDQLRRLQEEGVGEGPEAQALSSSLALYELRLGTDRDAAVRHARDALRGQTLIRDEEA